jgi:hypothetical protein
VQECSGGTRFGRATLARTVLDDGTLHKNRNRVLTVRIHREPEIEKPPWVSGRSQKTSERLSFRAVTLHIERFTAQGTVPSLSRLLDPFGSLLMLTPIVLELFLLCQTALQRASGCPEVNQSNPSNGLSGLPNSAGGILTFGLVAAKSKIDSDTVT